jgi:hypothetical protein
MGLRVAPVKTVEQSSETALEKNAPVEQHLHVTQGDGLVARWRALRLEGLDGWSRRHFRRPDVVFIIAWPCAVALGYVFLLFTPLSDALTAVLFIALLQVLWLPPFTYFGRARSLRADGEMKDLLVVADGLDVPVPKHPTWWRERVGPYRRLSVAVLVVGVAAVALAFIPLGYLDDKTWVAISGYTWFFGLLVLAAFVAYGRADRRRAFRREVRSVLDRTTGRDLAALRDRHANQLHQVERLLADRRKLERLYLSSEVELYEYVREEMSRIITEQNMESERRDRRFSIGLTLVSSVLSLLLGFLLGVWAKMRGWT